MVDFQAVDVVIERVDTRCGQIPGLTPASSHHFPDTPGLPEKLFAAVRAVAAGELAFSDELAQRVLNRMAQDSRQQAQVGSLSRLSERERQIAFAVARGQKNRDIATQFNISENTVKRHLQSIFSKTGARDRLELAVLALNEAGLAA